MNDAGSATLDNGGSCLIITGAPAAGKSTVSQLVAEGLTRSARLNGDFVHELIVSGFVRGLGKPPEEAAHQARLTRKNLCALAANFTDAGFTPVIDTLITDHEALDLPPRGSDAPASTTGRPHADHRGAPLPQHHPRAGRAVAFDDYETLTTGMRNGFGTLGWWFDTSALTSDETATQIITSAVTLAGRRL